MDEKEPITVIDPEEKTVIIQAYKHEPTGQIFEKKRDYEKCKAAYDKEQEEKQKRLEIELNWEKIINEPRLTATSIEDYRIKVMELYNKLNNPFGLFMKSLSFKSLTWSLSVSNSHSAPIGYETNWCGDRDKEGIPRGYPGWVGRMEAVVEKRPISSTHYISVEYYKVYTEWETTVVRGRKRTKEFQPHAERIPGMNTGNGGGGSYELRLYIYDFPLIYENYKQAFGKRDELLQEIKDRQKATEQYDSKKLDYVNHTEKVKEISTTIESLNTEISKLTTARMLHQSSLKIYREEADKEYMELNPFDYQLITELQSKLRFIEQQEIPT